MVEVISDEMPDEEFEDFIQILLDQLELCEGEDDAGDDGGDPPDSDGDSEGGCSLVNVPKVAVGQSKSSFKKTFFSASVDFFSLYIQLCTSN